MLGMNVKSMYQQASRQLGLAKKTSSGKDIANNPNVVMQSANQSTNYMQYPLKSGEETNDRCCKMRISAFKYLYDPNDINGNKRTMDSDNIKSSQVKKLYVIDLPLPASLTSGFSAGWTDYTSMWSKLIRGSGGSMGDISSFDPKAFGDNFIKNMGISDQVSQDSLKVGAGAAALSTALGGGIGQSVGEGALHERRQDQLPHRGARPGQWRHERGRHPLPHPGEHHGPVPRHEVRVPLQRV